MLSSWVYFKYIVVHTVPKPMFGDLGRLIW